MATHLVIDIETIPDPDLAHEDPDKVPPPAMNRIVTVGCLLMEDRVPRKLGIVGDGKTEREIVADLAVYLERVKPTLVTWNGRGFDMPVITSRALRHGIPMPWWFRDRNTRYRYSADGHFDLMDFLADHGAARSGRLDVFAKLVGFPGKVGVDGSQVAAFIADGRKADVDAYCLCDVVQTAAVFLRVELLRGAIDRDEYDKLTPLFLEFCDAEARLEAICGKVDRDSFRLLA